MAAVIVLLPCVGQQQTIDLRIPPYSKDLLIDAAHWGARAGTVKRGAEAVLDVRPRSSCLYSGQWRWYWEHGWDTQFDAIANPRLS